MATTRPKGASFNFADQGIFTSAIDVGCRTTKTAAENTALIIAALTEMGTASGGVFVIPHGISHTFTTADFPATLQLLCVWELTGSTFKLTTNTVHTSELGDLLASIRLDAPKAVKLVLVDVLTDPPAYTFSVEVYNNAGSPTIQGSSFDICTFVPGISTPVEAIARSGPVPGMHYFFKGININGVAKDSRSIQAPDTGATIAMVDGVEHLILTHAATIAALSVVLPPAPVDGTVASIFSSNIVTALTLTASHTIVGTLTSLGVNGSAEFVYNAANSFWYRMR